MAWAMAWRTRLSLRAGWPSPIGWPVSRAAPVLKASSSKPEYSPGTVVMPSVLLSELKGAGSRPSAKSISPFFSAWIMASALLKTR
jgi:hypothetical protein